MRRINLVLPPVALAWPLLLLSAVNPKPQTTKASGEKPVRKIRKGTAETARLFIDIEGMMRPPQTSPSRYVE